MSPRALPLAASALFSVVSCAPSSITTEQHTGVPPTNACRNLPLASLADVRLPKHCRDVSSRRMPSSVAEAESEAGQRLERVVRAWLRSFRGDFDDFGDWEREAVRVGLPRVMAGLEARQLLSLSDPLAPPADFPKRVERWLVENAKTRRNAGTDTSALGGREGDYDFVMMQILELIYHFRERPQLLTNDAIWALLESERYVVRTGRGKRMKRRIPEVGNRPHRMTFNVLVSFPETENHVLLTNAWAYLVNQWLERDYRNDPRVRRYFRRSPKKFRNEGSALERMLLRAMARIVQNGFFESNARPYQAYSLRALELLASYADDSKPGARKVALAARNALDYAATKFAFQSFEGKRLGPSRRNYDNRKRVGIYQNDYVPFVFGVLTGAHVYDDDPFCQTNHCAYSSQQARNFALGSALSSYRVPELIWDFMLRPDNHRAGHGVWARMQPRFTERHYLGGQKPRHPGELPDLNLAVERGQVALEPAPELYFITRSFMNSAGGRGERYRGQDGWTFGRYQRVYDVFSKPSVLMLPGDVGYWRDTDELENETLAFRGNARQFWESNNTGVYKNFVYGYTTAGAHAPKLPPAWLASHHARIGRIDLEFYDLSTNNALENPRLGLHVVTGEVTPRQGETRRFGFWEVFPAESLGSVEAVRDCVLEENSETAQGGAPSLEYTLCLSKDRLELNERYGLNTNAFTKINDSSEHLDLEHVDLETQRGVVSIPLLEAREVDERFRFTGVTYALAAGDGVLRIENPHLGRRLVIDASTPGKPRRRMEVTPKRAP